MIFGEASMDGAKTLKDILEIYANSLGELVNYEKSGTFFSPNMN